MKLIAKTVCILVIILAARLAAQDFRFLTPVFRSAPGPTLYLAGATGSNYVIEGSPNMVRWFDLFAGAPTNGQLLFVDTNAPMAQAMFYRARLGTIASLQVAPQADANQTASAFIDPDTGGSCSLTNEAGTRFTFSVGPSNVTEAVAIRMTLVTNFTAFPDYEDVREAVLFEPEGFQFWGAGKLEIEFPTNVPFLKLSSFAFGSSGQQFHLVPDLVSSNKVVIPVTHFSGTGTAGWSAAERGKLYDLYVEQVLELLSSDLARELGRARQAELLGAGEGYEFPKYLAGKQQEFFDLAIKPYLDEAIQNCEMAKVVMQHLNQMERQAQLLGAADIDSKSILENAGLKADFGCTCIQEAIQRCEEGHGNAGEVILTILSISRQRALLGSAIEGPDICGQYNLDQIMQHPETLPCTLPWMGWGNYSERGDKTTVKTTTTSTTTYTGSRSSELEFVVVKADLIEAHYPVPIFGGDWEERWQLTVEGVLTSKDKLAQSTEIPTLCGNEIQSRDTETSGAGTVRMKIEFHFLNGVMDEFTFGAVSNRSDQIQIPGYTKEYDYYPSCLGPNEGRTQRYLSPTTDSVDVMYFSPQKGETFSKAATNLITGSFVRPKARVGGLQEVEATWGFNLFRAPHR